MLARRRSRPRIETRLLMKRMACTVGVATAKPLAADYLNPSSPPSLGGNMSDAKGSGKTLCSKGKYVF